MFHQLSKYSPGTTTHYLHWVHNSLVGKASRKYNLTTDQVTAEVLQKYLKERKSYSKKKMIEREEQIVEIYEELRD